MIFTLVLWKANKQFWTNFNEFACSLFFFHPLRKSQHRDLFGHVHSKLKFKLEYFSCCFFFYMCQTTFNVKCCWAMAILNLSSSLNLFFSIFFALSMQLLASKVAWPWPFWSQVQALFYFFRFFSKPAKQLLTLRVVSPWLFQTWTQAQIVVFALVELFSMSKITQPWSFWTWVQALIFSYFILSTPSK